MFLYLDEVAKNDEQYLVNKKHLGNIYFRKHVDM